MAEEVQTKRCTKCGEVKPIAEFYFIKNRKAFAAQCRSCCCNAASKWGRNNPDKIRQKSRRYYEKHIDQYRRRAKLRYIRIMANPELRDKYKTRQRHYVLTHRENRNARERVYRARRKISDPLYKVRINILAHKRTDCLVDCYIRQCIKNRIYGIENKDITSEMIALEREHIALMRMIHQKRKEVA